MSTIHPPVATPIPVVERRHFSLSTLSTRWRLVLGGALAVLLALLALSQSVAAYNTAYGLFSNIAEVSSTTVDASEQALQDLAGTSQAAADYALLSSDTPLYEQAQNNIFRDFSHLRDELFALRNNIQTVDERAVFTIADTYAENRFWRHLMTLVALRSNDEQARQQYLYADDHVRNWISPALSSLESLNYQQMVLSGQQAGTIIAGRIVLLVLPALLVALLVTYLSFQLRRKIHRYLTPGIDAAAVVAWLLLLISFTALSAAPGQLHTMISDSYLSITGSARVLVDANLVNRAESSALLDPENAQAWYGRIDDAVQRVELRMCGQQGCMDKPFTFSSSDEAAAGVVDAARNISTADAATIDGGVPLMANVTFDGETQALEQARLAWADFLKVNAQLRSLIDSGKTADAIQLNTEIGDGTSQEAFNRFAAAMNTERDINRSVFNDVWNSARATLTTNPVLFGIAGYLIVVVLLIVGVYHRFREL